MPFRYVSTAFQRLGWAMVAILATRKSRDSKQPSLSKLAYKPVHYIFRSDGLNKKVIVIWTELSTIQGIIVLVIEGLRAKRVYIAFWANFLFLQYRAYFWQTDLFWHEKHRYVIIFVDLRFVFESLQFQIGLAFRSHAIMKLLARSTRPIWNYEHDFSLNCTTRGPITNFSIL